MVVCDRLLFVLVKEGLIVYIVNIDFFDEFGIYWILLWIEGNVCEIMDSYAVFFNVYGIVEFLKEWMNRYFKY